MSGYRGTANRFAKLVEAEVLAMRVLNAMGWSQYMIAKVFQVSRPHAKRIVRGEKWSWLAME